jgi:hypothetical protein
MLNHRVALEKEGYQATYLQWIATADSARKQIKHACLDEENHAPADH